MATFKACRRPRRLVDGSQAARQLAGRAQRFPRGRQKTDASQGGDVPGRLQFPAPWLARPMRANQANHLLLRIYLFRIPRCRFGLARHVPAFLCTSRLSRLACRPTAQCHTCMPHASPPQRRPNTMPSRCATRAANTPRRPTHRLLCCPLGQN
jgi:hypothetical protein